MSIRITRGKLVYIGADGRGVEMEVVAIPDDKHPGELAVIRALATHYRKDGPR